MKFFIAAVFALLKFLEIDPSNSSHLLFARSIFCTFHVIIFTVLFQTSAWISNKKIPDAEKDSAKKEMRSLLNSLLFRTIIIVGIHYKTGIMPPLFVSCVMASFSMLENIQSFTMLQTKFPILFR